MTNYKTWIASSGNATLVTEMTDQHIGNALSIMGRHPQTMHKMRWVSALSREQRRRYFNSCVNSLNNEEEDFLLG